MMIKRNLSTLTSATEASAARSHVEFLLQTQDSVYFSLCW